MADTWYGFDQVGIEPVGPAFDLTSQLLANLTLAAMQLLVLRVVMGISSPATKAWVPVTVLVLTAEYFVLTYWLPVSRVEGAGGLQLISLVVDFVAAGLFGAAQGLLLAEMLGSRFAAVIWTLSMIGADAVGPVLSLLVMSGVVYGGLTGAVLMFLVRRATRTDSPRLGPMEPSPAT